MHFKIVWASLINGRKFTVFTLFYFVFEGNFQVQVPRGPYIWRGDLTEGFLRYEVLLAHFLKIIAFLQKRVKLPLVNLNQHITCKLCNGYLIDAATITECLHTCKSMNLHDFPIDLV